ncbi:MAG: trehalose utilization protein ThuA, partial [Cohnella sp.]
MIRVTVWNEFKHERLHEEVRSVYPDGLHRAIAAGLEQEQDMSVRTATLPEPECGLTREVLDGTDVLIWWG